MKSFEYVIHNENGIHARPAGLLVKTASSFQSEIDIHKNGKSASAKRIFALMGLDVRNGDSVEVQIYGSDEETAYSQIHNFFKDNF